MKPGHKQILVSSRTCASRTLLLIAAGAMSGGAGQARANPVDLFGLGAREIGMGNAFTAVADDAFAPYYNLAGLVQIKRPTMAAGFVGGSMSFGDPKNCAQAQAALGCSEPFYYTEGGSLTIQQKQYGYDNPNGVGIGIVMPLTKKLNFGFAAYVPMQVRYEDGQFSGVGMRLARFKTLDPYLPEYVLFQNRAQRFGGYTGVSYEVLPGLGLGLGVSILANAHMAMDIKGTVEIASEDNGGEPETTLSTALDTQIMLDLVPKSRPIAGLYWNLGSISPNLQAWQLGATYRSQIGIDGDALISTDLALSAELEEGEPPVTYGTTVDGLTLTFLDFYTPTQVSFGMSGLLADRVRLALDLTWHQWSDFKLSVAKVPEALSVALGVEVALEDAREVDTSGFKDTFVPHFGIEARLGPFLTGTALRGADVYLRGGASYEPNPFPEQTGYTNLLNGDRMIGMVGTGVTTHNPFSKDRDLPIAVDLALQVQSLLETTHTKGAELQGGGDTTDGVPVEGVYVAQGTVVQGGLTVQMGF